MIKALINDISDLREKLENHEVYSKVKTMDDLRLFMDHHIYCVWDFMSLVKFLQHTFAPSQVPWKPMQNHKVIHFINDIVLEEESDQTPDGRYMSHFEMYLLAMSEIGADTDKPFAFVRDFNLEDMKYTFLKFETPLPAKNNIETTFKFINSEKPHIAASAFCFGRENIIPDMFSALLKDMQIDEKQAPMFHYYLSRHVQLDGEVHGPMALEMVEILCGDDKEKWEEATMAAREALQKRIALWDYISEKLN